MRCLPSKLPQAAASSQRNLERCNGGNTRIQRQKEVVGEINPAEGDEKTVMSKGRQGLAELVGQRYFNQAGMQEPAKVDTGRDAYDGLSVSA